MYITVVKYEAITGLKVACRNVTHDMELKSSVKLSFFQILFEMPCLMYISNLSLFS